MSGWKRYRPITSETLPGTPSSGKCEREPRPTRASSLNELEQRSKPSSLLTSFPTPDERRKLPVLIREN